MAPFPSQQLPDVPSQPALAAVPWSQHRLALNCPAETPAPQPPSHTPGKIPGSQSWLTGW